ncbi:MAG: UvrD-helicase domain-containing protein [Thermoguttaceae bacterium]
MKRSLAFPNTVIRASAGTGKTFQLSNRFLALSLTGATVDSILATTFTRKAAGEILDRVLLRLADAALSDEDLAKLNRQLGVGTMGQADCWRVLGEMVRQMHRLRIGTLDSFFLQVAQSFGLELGLPPGWQIVDELTDARLQRAAVRQLLQHHSTGDVLRLMHMLTKGQATRSVGQQIASLVEGLHGLYQESPPEAWHALPRRKLLSPPEVADRLDALENVELPPNKNWTKAHDKSMRCARDGDWEQFLAGGVASKLLIGETDFYRVPIPDAVRDAYEPLVEHAKAAILGQIANQTEATFDLLQRFDAAYRVEKLAQRAMRFDDVARRLAEADVAGRLDEVFYRLDVGVAHLLLDEFQDTSPLQWRVLRPLARRIVDRRDRRHSFFCVGDVKQAIYGWRGGAAEIFDAMDDELNDLQPESLNHSWRSSPPVIDCVNQVFGGLVRNAALRNHEDAARQWSQRFAEHSTERKDMPGYCALVTAAATEDGDDRQAATLQRAVDEIVAWRQRAPGRSIGVLVRRNAAVARLIFELRQRGVDASEEGGNPLTDSPAVELVLSLLTLADHPGDTVARFHAAHSPLAGALGLGDWRDAEAAQRFSLDLRQSLMMDGYGPTIYRWTKQLAAACDRRDLSRLLQLVELAHGYDVLASARADDFIALVRQRRIQNPSSAEVRVMTVHQAKGLQFDIVVLPELDEILSKQPPQMVVHRPSPVERVDRVCRYVSKELRPLLPAAFQTMFDDHARRIVEESLCVLYVAMTRAVHTLQMIVAPSRANEKTIPSTWAGLLRAALTDGKSADSDTLLYEHGDAQWFAREKLEATAASVEEPPPRPLRLAPSSGRACRGLDRRSPSELEGGPRMDLARQLRWDTAARLHRGSLLHAWFQEVEWLDDGRPSGRRLREIAEDPRFADVDVDALLKVFSDSLDRPVVRRALCRSTYRQPCESGDRCAIFAPDATDRWRWRVWRERPFAVREGDAILSGSIDRLVTLQDADRVAAAEVVDFKSDVIAEDDPRAVDARSEIYRPQMEAYRRAVMQLYGLAAERVSVRLLFVDCGQSRNV